jgi:LPPG:FO 2-phospho-L-lactate transferase
MKVTVLAGGVGGAKFLKGLVAATQSDPRLAGSTINVIANTGDDIRLFGLQICPDLDSIMYTLGGGADPERGWGRADETFTVLEELRAYAATPDWFGLGDRDLATHILRTQMLDAGFSLTAVTAALATRWDLPINLLPMSDDRIETHVVVDDPATDNRAAIHLQEWWVRHRCAPTAHEFLYLGAEEAGPSAQVLGAIESAEVIVIAPSNPVVSIGPILAVPGIGPALQTAGAPIVGVSPIVGGAALRGMADQCLRTVKVDVSSLGVAGLYGARRDGGLLNAWIVDDADAEHVLAIDQLGIHAHAMNTVFSDVSITTEVGRLALELGQGLTV